MSKESAASRIGSALAAWTRVVLRYRGTTILTCFVLVAVAANFAGRSLGVNTDTADMISPDLAWRQDYTAYRERFAIRDRNVVIVVEAPVAEDADRVANAIAEILRESPSIYRNILVPGSGEFFERYGLLFLSTDELEALSDALAAAQPLIGRLARRFGGAELTGVLSDLLDRGAGNTSDDAFIEAVGEVFAAAAVGERHTLSWHALFARGAARAARSFVLLQPQLDFSRPRPAATAIDGIRSAIGELEASFPMGTRVRVTGTVAMEHEEMTSVVRGASAAGIAALLLVAGVLYAGLRSVRLLVVSIVTLIAGLSLTAAFAARVVGDLNLISVAFAVLYIGLGVDFVLHLCLRFKELRSSGLGTDDSIVAAVRGVGESLVICSVTTAVGFFAFIPTPFSGVSELGLISGTGMFVSLAVSVTLLPALISTISGREPLARRAWLGTGYLGAASRNPRIVIAGAVLVALASAAMLPGASFDRNPINLRDPATESVRTLRELADDGDALPLNIVALASDDATAAAWTAELAALPEVGGVMSARDLVPRDQDAKLALLEDLELILGPDFADIDSGEPDLEGFLAGLESLEARLRAGSSGAGELSALDPLLDRIRALSGEDRAAALTALEADLLRTLPGQLARLAAGLAPGRLQWSSVPAELAARWVAADETQLIEVSPAIDVADSAEVERFVAAVRAVVPTATGLPVVYEEAGRTVVRAFQLAFAYALAAVSVILLVFLRSVGDAVLVLIPVLLAAGATAATAVLIGLEFNFANIIALPLLLGVGVDSGIHIVHRMRTEPPASGSFSDTSTSRAVLASGLTTVASFGNLAFASHVGMAGMGLLLTIGMIATLVSTLLLLPALLAIGDPV